MRKTALVLWSLWFALVFAVGALVSAPLNWWLPSIQPQLPPQVRLLELDGRLWQGQAKLILPNLSGAVVVQWRAESLLQPLKWELYHDKFQAFGALQAHTDSAKLWIDKARIDADTFDGVTRSQGISLSGQPIIIERFYLDWPWTENAPSALRGFGQWQQGEVRYPMGRVQKQAQFSGWQIQARLTEQRPQFVLLSATGDLLAGAKWLASQELEITVMPDMVEAVGQNWRGSREYPAFMMVQPLGF
ncbi:hypothetical protein FJM67_10695 [Maribrevibacterium harenarium]|uniref:General secretion pathway protein N n=1 Tax=Maribrevibacterium harenarium TaxID=2589817 RepID=A0A501WLU9_9GAMM|nr:hypothetical protein [Maribrevibacterium harenarium]TPE50308.1 hypothetical protein FJM67_10695 [Maribrevibacterium harenarium]